MTPAASDAQQYRRRAALGFLATGVALLFYAWISWFFRTSSPEVAPPINVESQSSVIGSALPDDDAGAGQRGAFVKAAPMILLVTFLLVIVFLGGSLILVRGLRRHQEAAQHKRRAPTPSDDVWAMQTVEDEFDEDAA